MTRTDDLTAKLLDGTLSDAEGAELDSLLAADPATAGDHFALLELEAALRGLRTGLDLAAATLERVQTAQAARTAASVMAEITSRPAPAWHPHRLRSRRRKLAYGGLGAVAVAAALAVGLWLGGQPIIPNGSGLPLVPDDLTFATLTQVLGSVELLSPTGEVVVAAAGRPVAPGQTIRTIGEDSGAVVELRDHTLLQIEPDTVIRFPSDPAARSTSWRVVLAQGQVQADVPARSESRPMVLSTPAADVLTRGGSFVVSSVGPESARVEPRKGSVQVVRLTAPKPVSVGAGTAAVIQPGTGPMTVEPSLQTSATPRRILSREAYPGIRDVMFSPNGKDVWAANGRMLVRWTADGGTADYPFYPKKGGEGIAARFSPDRIAVVTSPAEKDDGLVIRRLPDGAESIAVPTRILDARFLAVGPLGTWIATVDTKTNRKRVTVWDGVTGAERFARELEDGINCLAATPDGKSLAVGVTDSGKGANNKIVFFDAKFGVRLFALPIQKKGVLALAFSADSRSLAVGFTGTVQLWDVPSRELVRAISGFERVIVCLAFSTDARRLGGGTQDGQVWVWDAQTGNPVRQFVVGPRPLRALSFSPDGRSLVTAATQAPVAVWDVGPGE